MAAGEWDTWHAADTNWSRAIRPVSRTCSALSTSRRRTAPAVIELARQIQAEPATKVAGLSLEAYTHVRAGNTEKSSPVLDRALNLDRQDPWANFVWAKRLEMAQHDWEALSALETAIKGKPVFPEAYEARGRIHAHKHEYGEALDAYNAAIAQRDNDAVMYLQRGSVLLEQKQFAKARADFDRMAALDSDLAAEAKFLTACSLIGESKLGEAARMCDSAIRLSPWEERYRKTRQQIEDLKIRRKVRMVMAALAIQILSASAWTPEQFQDWQNAQHEAAQQRLYDLGWEAIMMDP
jgi:tetratricopeptide (TPR) repeat protein